MTVPQSKQAWLNLMIRTSLAGGFPSSEDVPCGAKCLYRSPEGRKCAIGLLIPDERYDKTLEGEINARLRRRLPEWQKPMKTRELNAVQQCHDYQALDMASGGWDHARFVEDLKLTGVFRDCRFPRTPKRKEE